MNETVKKVLKGDREAFRSIIIEYGPAIRSLLASHIYDSHTIDDLAQETFISAFQDLPRFDLSRDFLKWLRGIARNKISMHLRRMYKNTNAVKQLRAQAMGYLSDKIIEKTEKDNSELVNRLKNCIQKLKGQVSRVIQLRYFGQEKVEAIALELNTSMSVVSVQLHRGRKQLESCMQSKE
ncbi:RNA polymerase sigma factor [Planctomycetota bacterium]